MRKILLLPGAILLLIFSGKSQAQTSVNESSLNHLYNRAHDLFHKQKYSAAQDLFLQYATTGSNELLVSESRYYAALCAGELLLGSTVEKTEKFRTDFPESGRMDHSHYKLAEYYFRQKQYEKALFEFIDIEPLISLDPYETEAYYFMTGYCQFVQGNLNEARAYFDEIIDYQNEYYHLANYFHAYVSFENGEYDLALKGFKRIQNHPNFKDFVPIYICEVYAYNKEYDKVISYGDSILSNKELQKRHVVQLLLAQAYFKKKNFEKSKEYYFEYNDLRKLGVEDSYQYGYACFQTEDYKTAQKQFESFKIEEDSLGQNVSYLLGDCYLHLDQKMEARNSFQFASNLNFDESLTEESFYNYAKLSHELKFNKAAMIAFNDFIKKYPKSKYIDEAKVNFTRLLLSSNNHLQALEMIAEIPNPSKKIDEGYQRLAYNVGLEYLDLQNNIKAREYLNKSLARAVIPEYKALAHFWIGESLYNEERYEEAMKSYKNYLFVPESKNIPLTAVTNYNIAYCLIKTGNYKEALYFLDNYFKNKNSIYTKQFDADANTRTADCYYELRVYDKAVSYYQKIIDQKEGEQDYAMFQVGVIKGLQGNALQKIEILDQLVANFPKSQYTDDALFEKANEKFILGYRTQALREFEYLNQDFPNNPYQKKAEQKIGLIFYQMDQPEKAIAIFKKIVEEFPSTTESKESLRILKDIYTDWGKADEYFEWLAGLGGKYNIRESEKDSAMFQSALSFLNKNDCKNGSQTLKKYLETFDKGIYKLNALYMLADCQYELNDFNGALNSFDEIIALGPNEFSGSAIEKAAALCYEKDSFARAIPYLELRTQLVNNNTELMQVYEALAKCHLEQNNCAEAEKYLTKIKAFEGVEKDVIQNADYTLARCAMAKGNNTKAISIFSQIASENENRLGAECQYLTAYLYYKKEAYDSAKTAVITMKNNFPSQDYFLAKSFILLADVYAKKEDFFNAKAILNSIITNYEGDDLVTLAQEKLAKIEADEAEKAKKDEMIKESEKDTIEYNEK
ncbi:tetratricopeptide repeat protein [bacterium]|nr:tetratricopeptide repeat protein [bacterium]